MTTKSILGVVLTMASATVLGGPIPPVLYNTGVNDDKSLISSTPPSSDNHYWVVASSPDASWAAGGGVVVATGGLPPAGPWTANTATAQWVSVNDAPEVDPITQVPPPITGAFTYRMAQDVTDIVGREVSFNIADLASIGGIKGAWATDNLGVGVFVNGVMVPGSAIASPAYGVLHDFFIPQSMLLAGNNTLDFAINNLTGDTKGTALIVDKLTIVPEPSTWMAGLGALGLMFGFIARTRAAKS